MRAVKLSQRGDTIVEVLIAIAVASSVLAVTQAAMNRNFQRTRASQERTEGSKLAQGQIESLRALSESGAAVPTTRFCLDGITTKAITGDAALGADLAAEKFNDAAQYPAECKKNGIYHIGIKQDTAAAGGNDGRLYKIYVRWDRFGGGRDQVIMVYRR